ncbi:MAG: DNA polymerase III subunit gamma/tau C-terminal domain-containing protein, partial [Stenotrophomonas maltophilia]
HMLSKAAFNALLKTLEEPPEHVKFLLATTDPQKLPVTVLSRCLQFNLKRLDEDQIQGQMTRILAAEEIESDPTAIVQLAKAADGSLRDGLSLLDQAIAYAGGALREDVVRTMLGTVDRTQVAAMLEALVDGDGVRLLQVVAALAEFSPDWSGVLEALAEALHRIQVQQLVPGAAADGEGIDAAAFAQRLRPEVVQLWYQMALSGRRDLYLAPSPRAGFEMAVLRMLAFRPAAAVPPVPRDPGTGTEVNSGAGSSAQGSGLAAAPAQVAVPAAAVVAAPAAPVVAPAPVPAVVAPVAPPAPAEVARPAPAPTAEPAPEDDPPPWHQAGAEDRDEALAAEMASPDAAMVAPWEAPPARPAAVAAPVAAPRPQGIALTPSAAPVPAPAPGTPIALTSPEAWLELVAQSQLNGPSRQLAAHAAFISFQQGVLKLAVSPGFEYLCSDRSLAALTEALSGPLGQSPRIVIEHGNAEAETLHQRSDRQRGERQQAAETAFMADPQVQMLIQQHGARVVADSIRPFDE